jgi:hypothetical protein
MQYIYLKPVEVESVPQDLRIYKSIDVVPRLKKISLMYCCVGVVSKISSRADV